MKSVWDLLESSLHGPPQGTAGPYKKELDHSVEKLPSDLKSLADHPTIRMHYEKMLSEIDDYTLTDDIYPQFVEAIAGILKTMK